MSNVINVDFGRDSISIGITCDLLYYDDSVVLVRNTIRLGDSVSVTHHLEEL